MGYLGKDSQQRKPRISDKKIEILQAGKHWANIDGKLFSDQKQKALMDMLQLIRPHDIMPVGNQLHGSIGKWNFWVEGAKLCYYCGSIEKYIIGEEPIIGKLLELAGIE